jgi:hypothetical protein
MEISSELSNLIAHKGKIFHVDRDAIVEYVIKYNSNVSTSKPREFWIDQLLKNFTEANRVNKASFAVLIKEKIDPIPPWFFDEPSLQPMITEWGPISKKRKEPEPVPKYLGIFGPIENGFFRGTNCVTFEQADEASETMQAIRNFYKKCKVDGIASFVDMNEARPFSSRDLCDLVIDCNE